jgi:hypothetical protein
MMRWVKVRIQKVGATHSAAATYSKAGGMHDLLTNERYRRALVQTVRNLPQHNGRPVMQIYRAGCPPASCILHTELLISVFGTLH